MAKKKCEVKEKNRKETEPEEVKYTCKKCGLSAKKEKHLCKPKEK